MGGDDRPRLWKTVAAGGGAGVLEICAMYSTDVVKTRQQLSSEKITMIRTYKEIISTQGFRGLYRGVMTPILAEAPKRAWKFTANDQFKHIIAQSSPDGKLTVGGSAVAGSLAGITEALVNCPFETVKVRMISKENLARFSNSSECLRALLREEGPLALYNGLEPLMWRNGFWNFCYFGTIGFAQIKYPMDEEASKSQKLGYKFVTGSIGSMLGTLFNTPFDVVKSRMQQQEKTGEIKYRSAFQSIRVVHGEEGMGALYKGLVPRLARLGPGGGLMIIAFDFISGLLKDY